MDVALSTTADGIDFSLEPTFDTQDTKAYRVPFVRGDVNCNLERVTDPAGRLVVTLAPNYGKIFCPSLQEMTQWTVFGDNAYLIEFLYRLRSLPVRPRNILVRRFGRNDFAVFNPTAQVGENTGVLWDLSDDQRYLLADLDATEWQVVGPRKQLSLAQALYRWSRGTRKDRAWEVAKASSSPVFASAIVGNGLLIAGISTSAVLAVAAIGATSIPIFAIMNRFDFTHGQAKTLKKLEAVVAAPDAVQPAAIESSLAKRFEEVISAPRAQMPISCRVYLAALPLSGHHILSNLDALDPRTQEDASILLLDNLPQALQLHATVCAKTLSEQVRTEADERLRAQLQLIDAEAERLVQAIDTALAHQQDVFGRYLDSRIGRSELDR